MKLDWSTAEVHNRTLAVGLRGERPPGWDESFERAVALLPAGTWGKVKLKKTKVRVKAVANGSEDRLHHFLESVVMQANAAHEPNEPEARRDDQEPEHNDADPLDVEMTNRFQSFAAEQQDRDDRQ